MSDGELRRSERSWTAAAASSTSRRPRGSRRRDERSVPRVRSMRKWYYPSPGPWASWCATGAGTERIETHPNRATVRAFSTSTISRDRQTSPLELRRFRCGKSVRRPRLSASTPLCDPRGGDLRLMTEITCTKGKRSNPGIRSHDQRLPGRTSAVPDQCRWHEAAPRNRRLGEGSRGRPTLRPSCPYWRSGGIARNARRFGVVGAYDGHRAGVGRVAVDLDGITSSQIST